MMYYTLCAYVRGSVRCGRTRTYVVRPYIRVPNTRFNNRYSLSVASGNVLKYCKTINGYLRIVFSLIILDNAQSKPLVVETMME